MMAKETRKVAQMREILAQIGGLCDTGFALAIHIRFTRSALLYRTYDPKWIEHYSEKGYFLSDPVVHWGLTNEGAVDWDALMAQDTEGVLSDARRFGLSNGWTFAVGPATSRTISGHTKSGAAFTPDARRKIEALVTQAHDLTNDIDSMDLGTVEALRAL
jgi:LuxR family transcriptional regulator, quorum-sensing system regulator SdiA